MKDILIDCDPGHDDAMTLLTALANTDKLNLLGVTTIGGNQSLAKVTQNAQNILSFLDAKVPLAMGQPGPLVKKLTIAPQAHGDSGMDGHHFSENHYPIVSKNAVTFLYEKLMQAKSPVTLVCIGPLTNIALLLKTYPEIHQKIAAICLMGGGLDHGNVTAVAEFNIYVDPEAAHIVFHSQIPIVMAGLDVTEKATILVSEIDQLKDKGPVRQLVYDILHFYNVSGRQFGFVNSPIHDLCTVAYLLAPNIFTGHYYDVDVNTSDDISRGQTFADKRLRPEHHANALVLENVDRQAFADLFLKSLAKLDLKQCQD